MSLASRRILLVPLPLSVQNFLKFTSDALPTLSLFAFVAIQFVLNILHYIPAKHWKVWVKKTRIAFKLLLDSDYRHEKYQLDLLHQRLLESEQRASVSSEESSSAISSNKDLKERLLKASVEHEQQRGQLLIELGRVKKRLEDTTKTLEETESLLETYRRSGSTDAKRATSEETKEYLNQISNLESRFAQAIREKKQITEDVMSLKSAHSALQERVKNLGDANLQLLSEKEEMRAQVDELKARETQLVASRDQFLQRLDTELKDSAKGKDEIEALKRQVEEEKALKSRVESLELDKIDTDNSLEQALKELEASRQENDALKDLHKVMKQKIHALEENHTSGSAVEDSRVVDGPVERKERIEQDRIEELESEVRGNKEVIEGLRKDMGVKNDEIARLQEALDHANARPHKLIKPRRDSSTSRPITPPATISHFRSNSISSKLGFGSQGERRVSGSSFVGNSKSADISPIKNYVPIPGPSIHEPTTEKNGEGEADASFTNSVGSATAMNDSIDTASTLALPSNGIGMRHGRTKSRQRLSSFFGIHLGTPEKDK